MGLVPARHGCGIAYLCAKHHEDAFPLGRLGTESPITVFLPLATACHLGCWFMDGTILDPDGAREHLAAWKGRIDKMSRETEAMRLRLQDLRVTVSDANGLVEVSVDSTGALVGLRLTERIGRVAPDVVARAIMATLGEARNTLADRSKEVIEDTVGAESAAARAIVESVDRHLRRDVVEDAAEQQERRGRADDVDDDGYDPLSSFRG